MSSFLATMECQGCAHPLDYDIDVMDIPFHQVDSILKSLGTCASCSMEFRAERVKYRCEWCYPYASPDECTKTKSCLLHARFTDAQMKERLAYVSKDMLSTQSLNDRIVTLVQAVSPSIVRVNLHENGPKTPCFDSLDDSLHDER